MNKQVLKQKLDFWKEREQRLEERFKRFMKLRGEAAAEGDLSENAGYEMHTQDAQVTSAQLAQVKKTIKELEGKVEVG